MSDLQSVLADNEDSVKRMEARTPELCRWFDAELMALHAQMPQSNGGLLMGCPVWGDGYIERMLRYSLPTLGAERNIAALAGKCWMVFYTPAAHRPSLWAATRWLRIAGIHTIWRNIPDELLADHTHGADKYGVLAACQNILTHMAGHAGMGLHMYMPDHLYSEGYFERLAHLGGKHAAVLQQSVSVADTSLSEIESHRHGGGLAVPARTLGGIAVEHMHVRSRMHVVNWGGSVPDKMPDARGQLIWIGRDAMHIADPCRLLAYLSPELCLDSPIAFTSTLDMLAPEYVPPGKWYQPTPDDDMTFVELSDSRRLGPSRYVSMERFMLRAWSQVAFTDDYVEYMERLCRVPIPERADAMPDDEITKQHELVLEALRDGKAWAIQQYLSALHPSRWS